VVTNYYMHERNDCIAFLRAEAARMRARDEGADAAVAAHFEIVADQFGRGEHEGAARVYRKQQRATELSGVAARKDEGR